ncbi:MAG: hypothetical protein ACE5EX_08315 [Phycisphaerae bacterium]
MRVPNGCNPSRVGSRSGSAFRCALLGSLLAVVAGCTDTLSPDFVNVIDPGGSLNLVTLDPGPGHVVVAFVNNATVDERLLNFLENSGGVQLTPEEKQNLHPLIRATLQVTFADLTVLEIEAVTGNTKLVQQGFQAPLFDETIPPQTFARVGLCDVISVELLTADTEFFVPVELTEFELIEVATPTGNVGDVTFEARTRTPPQFQPLRIDDVDAGRNVILLRNVDIRNVPTPVTNPVCGSVIAIVLDGTLSVPFLTGVSEAPSFDQDDEATRAAIGGRFRFSVTIK